ncbi:TetR/AcrR family transcriptional regulator [Parafrankia sp. FMc6]|uniref:TetR/AcrR family transcriptional regulator n=1 Tax=Parafrankia soli TaxID=2599596 RepID=UPI0034D510C2
MAAVPPGDRSHPRPDQPAHAVASPADRPKGRANPTRPAERTQPRGDRTRAAIIDETVRCVREEGFGAASARHIAERAGVTWGVIQYHFGDRDGLFTAVIESGYQALRACVEAVQLPNGTTRERVSALVDAAWAAFSAPMSMASLEISLATRTDRSAAQDAHLENIGRQLHQLGAVLTGRPEDLLGDLVWAALRGMVLSRMVVREPVEFTSERALLVDLLVAYLDSSNAG